MTETAATILLYLVALFLTVATLWLVLYGNQTISTEQTDPQSFWVFIVVVIPFLMLIYFGSAFLISDTISVAAAAEEKEEFSVSESLVLAVSYVGLSGWLWLRWRNTAVHPAMIATAIIVIIAGVIWAAQHDLIF